MNRPSWTYSDALAILLYADETGLAMAILDEVAHDRYSVLPMPYRIV